MSRISRIAFVTIGQTPRSDIVPEMMAEIAAGLEVRPSYEEFGVLDGLEGADLDAFRARDGEHSFATRLASGEEIVSSKARTEERLNELLAEIDGKGFDIVVLLCTGTRIDPLQNTLVVEAQRIVDSTVEALAASCRNLGVILPLERQVAEFGQRHVFAGNPTVVSASPYSGAGMAAGAKGVAACDLVVMHCMGYTAAMLDEIRQAVDAPVLLSRRVVAGVVRQMI
ncbi:AroM family protein [Aliihoeflea sp. 40Bstr573]|uniref:AroM family protein n=1 Tax=Aliihoeflea sp. 40Bstr573 TaxID=2696467 RepID=UPI00209444D1|nr:AroM family protein [Aliihoeflea sp. 40Bstr573]MCO6387378.1 AroM family protein [Aliihoeflea sp. 40Bstr573]